MLRRVLAVRQRLGAAAHHAVDAHHAGGKSAGAAI
jgi:L-alanine-DL-glutamate epimerase-like enolase superfamily enzyme